MLSFFSSSRNWDSPNPSPADQYAPPGSGGRGILAGERGVRRDPIPTRGQTLWYFLYIRTLWVVQISNAKEKPSAGNTVGTVVHKYLQEKWQWPPSDLYVRRKGWNAAKSGFYGEFPILRKCPLPSRLSPQWGVEWMYCVTPLLGTLFMTRSKIVNFLSDWDKK